MACLPSVVLTMRRNLVVLDHVDDVRTAFEHLVDAARHAMPASLIACAVPAVATSSKPCATSRRASFTAVGLSRSRTLIRHTPARRQRDARGGLRLRKRFAESAADAHHFAGRVHLGAEDRIALLGISGTGRPLP